MNLLFEHFGLLTQTPGHIARLKGLILQLAVQGKLVPQDPNDEPASELLKSILTQNKNRRKTTAPTISKEETPFELPTGWAWARLSDITENFGQKQPDKRFTYIDVASINQSVGVISNETNVLMPDEAPSRARKIVKKGCVIYSTVRPYLLNVAVVDEDIEPEPIVSTAFAVMNPLGGISESYLFYYLRSEPFTTYVESQMVGLAYPAINDEKLFKGIVPIPPVSEQHRIVARVDELFSQLEALTKIAAQVQEGHRQVGQAMLHQLGNAASPGDLERSWSRIAGHFGDVFSDGSNVKALRQTILQLAVQGKLVPQDPADEPAAVLLEHIKDEKERLVREKKIKKEAPLPPLSAEEIPYELPKGWVWCRLGEIAEPCSGVTLGKSYKTQTISTPYLRVANVQRGFLDLANIKTIDVPEEEIKKYKLIQDDLLMTEGGDADKVGRCAIWNDEIEGCIHQNHVFRVRLVGQEISRPWAVQYINSPVARAYYLSCSKQTTNLASINMGQLRNTPFPLPPSTEQQRIVARVESLLALCDQLETAISQSEEQAGKLLQAVLREAVTAEKEVEDVV